MQKAKIRIASVHQRAVEKEAQTDQLRAEIEERTKTEVGKIESQIDLVKKQTNQKVAALADQIDFDRRKAFAEAEYYKSQKEAEANKLKLSTQHIANEFYSLLEKSKKTYFGSSFTDLLERELGLAATINLLDSNPEQAHKVPSKHAASNHKTNK